MSWKKHFKAPNLGGNLSPISGLDSSSHNSVAFRNYQSTLPEVYVGVANRTMRYQQYEQMDADSEVNAALDILAEFSTQVNIENGTAFDIFFKEKPTDNEIKIIRGQLNQWYSLNEFNKRMFKIFRNTIKYGDQIFIRDPETFKLMWSEMSKVTTVIVNESDGKTPEQYVIKDINPNFQSLTVTAVTTTNNYMNNAVSGGGAQGYYSPPTSNGGAGAGGGGSRFSNAKNEAVINAEHIVHLSLAEGLDIAWPFGQSVLETVFKVFKQKELLEDAIIIYRIQRAPERRIFKIDVGGMPAHLGMAFVERVKNEVHQRRIPSSSGGNNFLDTSYNPLCLDLSTKIPLLDGRTLSLTELINEFDAGKENWTYSCDPVTGEVVPGVINWAGITRKNTEVIELTLDNGKTLVCTPDHKIPVFSKGFVEAKDLTTDDSLIAFNTREKSISGGKTNKYQQIWDHNTKSWKWSHRLVGEFFRKLNKHQEFTYLEENIAKSKTAIHHKDYNRFNNDPRNLTFMNKEDHMLYHSAQKSDFWKTIPLDVRENVCSKISETTIQNWEKLTETERLTRMWNIRAAQKKAELLLPQQSVPELNLTFEMIQRLSDYVKSGVVLKKDALLLAASDKILLPLVKSNTVQYKVKHSELNKLLAKFGYDGWKHFVQENNNFNHRIVSIRKVENRDTGTITIDGHEKWHSHHTFATDSGIFVKNSMNEDFFFPTTADGRGSSVEVMPGGCLTMDTLVLLQDGRTLSLLTLTEEFNAGKENWVYSCDPATGEVVPGLISWSGVTQKSAKVMRLTLDNGKVIVCTPDHKFPILGKDKMRADELSVGESLISFNINDSAIKSQELSHTIITIALLDEPIEVGTLTIDQHEVHHAHHNFALASGVFTQNSNLGEITDLRFFTNKMFRGLRIPASYLPTQTDEASNSHNDGKVGIAMIQEWRFNQYCKRLQSLIAENLDKEFKLFMRFRGINIDNSVFELRFNEPQNFTKYRQVDIDTARIGTFSQLEQLPYMSKRFLMQRYLDLSEEEIQENQEMWAEEHADSELSKPGAANLRSVGVSAGSIMSDMDNIAPAEGEGAPGDLGTGEAPGGPPSTAAPAPAPGAAALT